MPVQYTDEQEAKTLWCPYARVFMPSFYRRNKLANDKSIPHEATAGNRTEDQDQPSGSHCIGSRCAKWDAENKFGELTGRGRCGA